MGIRPFYSEKRIISVYLLQFFEYAHLPAHLQEISKSFGELAKHLASTLPNNPELTVAIRKLLESKDCAVRAQLFKENYNIQTS